MWIKPLQTTCQAYYAAYHTITLQLTDRGPGGGLSGAGRLRRARAPTMLSPGDDSWSPASPQDGGHRGWVGGWVGAACWYPGVWQCGAPVQPGHDAPLPWDPPVEESQCKGCSLCVQRCPEASLGPLATLLPAPGGPTGRRSARDPASRMKAATGIDTDRAACAFAVCPHTQRYLRGAGGNRSIKPINRRTPPGAVGKRPQGALLCRGSGGGWGPVGRRLHPVCSPIFGGQNLEGVPEGLGRTCSGSRTPTCWAMSPMLPSVSRSRRAASSIRWCFMWAAMGGPYTP